MKDFVIGIDVGAQKKGFHLAVMELHSNIITSFFHARDPKQILIYIRELEKNMGQCLKIAIDAPSKAIVKQTRIAEKEVRSAGYRILWTPTTAEKKQTWMENGELLWKILEREYKGRIIESFPTINSDHLYHNNINIPLCMLTGKTKRKTYADYIDAALCCKAAEGAVLKTSFIFGKKDPIGPIHTLHSTKIILTLCIICSKNRVLLGHKKRGFGSGLWNGFGGKVEAGETPEEAMIRETEEEACISPKSYKQCGLLHFSFDDQPQIVEVHVFRADGYEGHPAETEEMAPRWFSENDLPFDNMWQDDRYWFPLLLANKSFEGYFFFKDQQTLDSYTLEEHFSR